MPDIFDQAASEPAARPAGKPAPAGDIFDQVAPAQAVNQQRVQPLTMDPNQKTVRGLVAPGTRLKQSQILPSPQAVDQGTTNVAQAMVQPTAPPPMPFRVFVPPGLRSPDENRGEPLRGNSDADQLAALLRFPFVGTGIGNIATGFGDMQKPGLRNKAGGASEIIRGGLDVATPLLPDAIAKAPLETMLTMGTGIAAQAGTEKLLKAAGVPPEYAALGSDLVAVFGAGGAYAKLRALSKLPLVAEANTYAGKLRTALERAKDTKLSANDRAGARAQADSLIEGLRKTEQGKAPAVAVIARPQQEDIFDQAAKSQEKPHVTQPTTGRGQTQEKTGSAQGQPAAGIEQRQPGPAGSASHTAAGAPASANVEPSGTEWTRGAWDIEPLEEKVRKIRAVDAERNRGRVDRIVAGTLGRHQLTAQAYAETNPQAGAVESDPAFNPMALGKHEGREVTPDLTAEISRHMRETPEKPLGGVGRFSGEAGEAPQQWIGRLIDGVRRESARLKPGQKTLIVTSGRDMQAIRAWAAAGRQGHTVDQDVLAARWKSQPGEMMNLDPRTGKITEVTTAQEGLNFVRHAETPANKNEHVPREIREERRTEERRNYYRALPVTGITAGDEHAGPNQRIRQVPLADLEPTQPREETLGPAKGRDVERYREMLRAGSEPPPLAGAFNSETGKVELSEGHRRYEALKAEGRTHAPVVIGGLGEPPVRGAGGGEAIQGLKPGEPGWVGNVPLSQLTVDAPRFQFKRNVGQGGAGEEFREVRRWDAEKAGVVSVWRDPRDGKDYIVNGHHRFEMRSRIPLGPEDGPEKTLTVRYLKAETAEQARAKGAFINIAEGRGESTDAAKVFRDSGMTMADLEREGVSLKGKVASEGLAISKLAQPLYDGVMSGEIATARGAILGQIENPQQQLAVWDLMKQRERAGKRLTNDQVAELIRLQAPAREETQENLFGVEEMTRSLLPEKAEVSEYVRKQLGGEKRLFSAVGTQAAAEKLGEAGNVIKADENASTAQRASQAQLLYDKYSTTAGPIGTMLDRAAERIADGEDPNRVKQETYRQIRAALGAQADKLTGVPQGDAGRVEGLGSQGAPETGRGERNPEGVGAAPTPEPAGSGGEYGHSAQDLSVPFDGSKPRSREETFREARWEAVPPRRGGPPVIRMNRQALDAINDALGSARGGIQMTAGQADALAGILEGHARRLEEGGELSPETARHLRAMASAIRSHGASHGAAIYLADGSIPLTRRGQILMEEHVHSEQAKLGEDLPAGPERDKKAARVLAAVVQHPAFSKASAALRTDPLYRNLGAREIANEITAKLIAGRRGETGLSLSEGWSILRNYFSAIRNEYGTEAAKRMTRYADNERIIERRAERDRRVQAKIQRTSLETGTDGKRVPSLGEGRGRRSSQTPSEGGEVVEGEDPPSATLDVSGNDAAPQSQVGPQRDADKLRDQQNLLFPSATLHGGIPLDVVGAIFKADMREMLELKAKRDAAREALEKSKETPEDKRFGAKVLAYFTGERDVWGARVNQVMARLRKLVPDAVEQEALSLMRDFKGREQELTQFLQGTHPALFEQDENTPLLRGSPGSGYAAAMEQIAKMRPAILKALNPTPRMLEADQALTRIAAGTLKEGQRLGFLDSRWTEEQYNPHILNRKGEGEFATPARDRWGKALGGKVGKYFGFAERREYPSLLHAVAEGLRPKTLNAFDAFTIHGDNFATARATHLLEKQLAETGVGRYAAQGRAPKGWVRLAPHSNEFRKLVPYLREGPPGGSAEAAAEVAARKIAGMRAGQSYHEVSAAEQERVSALMDGKTVEPDVAELGLWVPPHVEKALRPVTDPDYLGRIPAFKWMRHTQSYQKAVQLGLSMFHAASENYMALANMGPKGWAKALKADAFDPEFEKAERDFIAHGGTTAIQGKTVEAYKALEPGSIPSWTDIWRKAPVIHQADELAGKITEFTFGKLQRQFKVTDYQLHMAAWMAEHPGATTAEVTAAKASVAKEINAVYGGLHTELLGMNRATTEVARALLLAPDWTFSNVFNVKYALERGTEGGKLARMFWIRQLAGGAIATQLLSLALSKRLSPNPTQVYFGKDKEGQDIYQNVFFKGAAGDAINLVHNVYDYGAVEGLARTLQAKSAGLVRTGVQALTNRDYLGHTVVSKDLNPIAATVRGAYKIGESLAPVPFSVANLKNMLIGPHADDYTVPEFLTTFVAGNPPRHEPPPGFRMGEDGLEEAPEPGEDENSIWRQMLTNKRYGGTH